MRHDCQMWIWLGGHGCHQTAIGPITLAFDWLTQVFDPQTRPPPIPPPCNSHMLTPHHRRPQQPHAGTFCCVLHAKCVRSNGCHHSSRHKEVIRDISRHIYAITNIRIILPKTSKSIKLNNGIIHWACTSTGLFPFDNHYQSNDHPHIAQQT